MPRLRSATTTALFLSCVLCGHGCGTPPHSESAPAVRADEPKVERGLEEAVAAGGERDLLVQLTQPAESAPISHAGRGDDAATLEQRIRTREAAYAAAAERLRLAFTHDQLEVRAQFRHLPMLLIRLRSSDVLRALSARDEVAKVFDDRSHAAFLAQSLELIGQPAVAATGQVGAGTAVAVLDTGCDFTHPAFGQCSRAGVSGCSVAFASDFASDDHERDDTGHGTHVSGIVLGVAPAAKILALDVFDGDQASSSDVLRAVDWVIENHAAYNIVAMNMSFGAGAFSEACGDDVFAAALANARDVGIIPVAASGNSGASTAIASPACVPAALSVGGVYDADVGGLQFRGCTDASTGADRIMCFSNSAPFLSLLAPGGLVTAAGSTQAGTSRAAAHVAGALAVMRGALPDATADTLVARITRAGPLLTDPRNGVATHRLDLQAALAEPADAEPPGPPPAMLDTTPPENGWLSATPGDATVVLTWGGFSDLGSGIAEYLITFAQTSPPASCSDGTVLYRGAATSFTQVGLTNGMGYGYRVCAIDGAGHVSSGTSAFAQPQSRIARPSGSVLIDDGAAITQSARVVLTLAAAGTLEVVEMCLSVELACSTWLPYSDSRSFTFAPGDGTRTLHVWFRDSAGNVSAQAASDSIVLDTAPPIDGSVTALAGNSEVALSWSTFSDAGAGIALYRVLWATTTPPASCESDLVLYEGTEAALIHAGLTNGTTYAYRVCAIDPLGNVSNGSVAIARPLPEFDAPAGSVQINAGAAATNSTTVTVALSASDASTPTHVCLSGTTHCSTWQTLARTRSFTFTAIDGPRSVYAWFRDQWGNTSAQPVQDDILLDRLPPRDGRVTVAPGDGTVALSFTGFSDAHSGLAEYRVAFAPSTAPVSCAAGTLLYAGIETTLSHAGLSNGTTYAYRVCAVNHAGNVSGGWVVKAMPLPETDAPVGSIVLNDDSVYTNSLVLSVSVSAIDASTVTEVCFSATTRCGMWHAYAARIPFTLGTGDGVRTVHAWFRDNWGNTSALPVSDSIVVDRVRPVDGSAFAVASDASVALSWDGFSDASSGLAGYRVVFAPNAAPATCATGSVLYQGSDKAVTHGALTNGSVYGYRVCGVDAAGNLSAGKGLSARPAPEHDAPTGSVTIEAGAAYTSRSAVTLTLAASDASGVSQMCLSSGTTCSAWIAFSERATFTLLTGQGTRSVNVWFRDAWGNVNAAPVTDSIVRDTTAPVMGGLSAIPSSGAVMLAWDDATDTISGVDSYTLVWARSSIPPTSCALVGTQAYSGAGRAYSHEGLSPGTYSYRLCAVDRSGNVASGATRSVSVP